VGRVIKLFQSIAVLLDVSDPFKRSNGNQARPLSSL